MTDIVIGETVINKLGEKGVIVSFDEKTISVDFAKRTAKLQRKAFDEGFLRYENVILQEKINEETRQTENAKQQADEAKHLASEKAKEECRKLEAEAPVGVKFNSVSLRLEKAPASFNSVKNKHKDLVQEIFDECDKDINAYYDSFRPHMTYITPRYHDSHTYLRSRYCVGFVAKYRDVYVLRVISRNDIYVPGMIGGYTVTNSDITEIMRILCVDGKIYSFSKHLSCDYGSYRNSTSYKKWQASTYVGMVKLNKVIGICDCGYLNDYINEENVNCLSYVKLFMNAISNNKVEILFKNKSFLSIADIDDVPKYVAEFSSKQIDFASKNEVIHTLPIIKRCGLFETEILQHIEYLMTKDRNSICIYDKLAEFFIQNGFDLAELDKKLIAFLRKLKNTFAPPVYSDYINCLLGLPGVSVNDLFDKDYMNRHYQMMLEKNIYVSTETRSSYVQAAQELSWINREENGYYIIVPKNVTEFKNEGQIQHNCVFTCEYYLKVIDRKSIIVFLRKNKEQPYITIEFKYEDFRVLQAYGKYNSMIDSSIYRYVVDLGKRLYEERLSWQ